jgi:hypothetical protein
MAADSTPTTPAPLQGEQNKEQRTPRISFGEVVGRHAAQASMTWPNMPLCPARDSLQSDAAVLRSLAVLIRKAKQITAGDYVPNGDTWIDDAVDLCNLIAAGFDPSPVPGVPAPAGVEEQ